MISAIGWVSELIESAGGENVFPDLAKSRRARDRIICAEQVIAAQPDIIIGSWCGKGFKKHEVVARKGFDGIPAVRNDRLYEIKSAIILQPGPAAMTDGLAAIQEIISAFTQENGAGGNDSNPARASSLYEVARLDAGRRRYVEKAVDIEA